MDGARSRPFAVLARSGQRRDEQRKRRKEARDEKKALMTR
jgi:hypothetical protein